MSGKKFLQPFREAPMLLLFIGFFFLTFGVFIPITYVVINAKNQGMSNGLAQYLVPMLNAAR